MLPRFLSMVMLLLNLGTVREGERVLYHSVPWQVAMLHFYVRLVNPALEGGELRLTLSDALELRSWAFTPDEPWFPTQKGDWLLLGEQTLGQVVLQTPETVRVRFLERFFPELLVPVQPPNTVDSTWTIYYNFDQYLWSPEGHPDRGIGVFFRFGATDGVANPIKYTYNVGIGGRGLVPGRPSDNFGLGWARTELSGNFVPFLRQQLRLGLGHEDAIELYYNAAITPWISAALDLQIIDQALARTLDVSGARLTDLETAVVVGLRVYARF
jgi:hypothetical protein